MKTACSLFCILIMFMSGCAPAIRVMHFTDSTYSPTGRVEVFRTALPQRPYTEIAQLETSAHDEKAVSLLRAKAREIGADAIILIGEAYRGTSYGY